MIHWNLLYYAQVQLTDPLMSNREKLLDLIDRANITRERAAELIAEETKRPCSWRAIQAWLADPSLPSARPCKDWVINALEARLRFLKLLA